VAKKWRRRRWTARRRAIDSAAVSQSTPRRLYPRQLRRLAVRFWREGEERARQGFTKNVSLTGALVSTPDPAGRGERLRLELSDAGRGVLLYAVVVHSHRVPAEFRRFVDSAMGLRFLGLDEVVGPFLGEEALQPLGTDEPAASRTVGGGPGGGTGAFPSAGGGTGAVPATGGARDRVGTAPRGGEAGGGGAGERAAGAPGGPSSAGAGPAGAGSSATGSSPRGPDLSATGSRPLPSGGPTATYSLAFATGADFLATYRRDLLNGGLFVTTDRPARLNDRVLVDLRLPGAGAPTIRVEGRVVQVVDPRPLASGRTAGGMGLELVDPDQVVHRLAPHVAAYER
jgi:Tfp pilus assembly protein PilZ